MRYTKNHEQVLGSGGRWIHIVLRKTNADHYDYLFFINRHEDIFFAVISIRDFNIVGGLDR